MTLHYEVTNRIAEGTIKLLITVNGAAAVATLGFAGSLLGTDGGSVIDASVLASSIKLYVLGVMMALFSLGFLIAFLTFDADPIISKWWFAAIASQVTRAVAWLCGIASGVMFLVGAWTSANGLATFVAPPPPCP